jgi:hypothetical protein
MHTRLGVACRALGVAGNALVSAIGRELVAEVAIGAHPGGWVEARLGVDVPVVREAIQQILLSGKRSQLCALMASRADLRHHGFLEGRRVAQLALVVTGPLEFDRSFRCG